MHSFAISTNISHAGSYHEAIFTRYLVMQLKPYQSALLKGG